MFTHRLFCLLIVVVSLIVTACAHQVEVGSTATSLLESNTPPVEITPTTSSPAATATQSPIVPMAVNDASMSRLRLTNLVYGSGDMDMYVDGQIALLGNRQSELRRVPVGFIPGFLYVEPGMHSIAIVPTGKDLGSAMIALDVPLEAGHRYTVVAMGQKEDASAKALVIDETQALATARTSSDQLIMVLANNIRGADMLDFLEDGAGPRDIPYGGFVAAPIKAGHVDHLLNIVNGDQAIEELTNFDEPSGIDFLHILNGSFPGAMDSTIFSNVGPYMSDLTTTELLKQMSAANIPWGEDRLSFNTFLELVDQAGLEQTLSSGTYLIFAPTDQAFEDLPTGKLDALRSDPESLATYLGIYIVEGYYPYGGLSGASWGSYDSTIQNLQGMELKIGGDLSINNSYVGSLPSFTVVNGTRIIPVSKLLVSPD